MPEQEFVSMLLVPELQKSNKITWYKTSGHFTMTWLDNLFTWC